MTKLVWMAVPIHESCGSHAQIVLWYMCYFGAIPRCSEVWLYMLIAAHADGPCPLQQSQFTLEHIKRILHVALLW
jgi:hypothetical protein